MTRFPEIRAWLTIEVQRAPSGKYEHCLAKEQSSQSRAGVLARLRTVVSDAHDDARRRLRRLATGSLDPLGEAPDFDAADGYPGRLHIQTLKGYFGEILAGLAAEHLHCDNGEWEVPAHLFRCHLVEFQQLAMMAQTGAPATRRPGRTGEDCLAFRRNADGSIISTLFCEAKCTADHDASMVNNAHEQSSIANLVPVDLLQLIEVLEESSNLAASRWVEGLRRLLFKGAPEGYERRDQITYVAGRSPTQKDRKSWIPLDKPHEKYTGDRGLHVFELHLDDVEGLINDVYTVK